MVPDPPSSPEPGFYLFVGTYGNPIAEGIYLYSFNTEARIEMIGKFPARNPSFLHIANNEKTVYAVNENSGKNAGEVSAYRFDKSSRQLHFLNSQKSGGDRPCYITVDASGTWAVVANYGSGTIAALPINKNGSLAPTVQLIDDKKLLAKDKPAHAHSVVFSPDGFFLLAADLGLDAVITYSFNSNGTTQPLLFKSSYDFPTGHGPRHIIFHPQGNYVYVSEELSGMVSVFSYNKGNLNFLRANKGVTLKRKRASFY